MTLRKLHLQLAEWKFEQRLWDIRFLRLWEIQYAGKEKIVPGDIFPSLAGDKEEQETEGPDYDLSPEGNGESELGEEIVFGQALAAFQRG